MTTPTPSEATSREVPEGSAGTLAEFCDLVAEHLNSLLERVDALEKGLDGLGVVGHDDSSRSSVAGTSEGSDAAGSTSPDSAASCDACQCGAVSLCMVEFAIFSDKVGAVMHRPTECVAVSDLSFARRCSA